MWDVSVQRAVYSAHKLSRQVSQLGGPHKTGRVPKCPWVSISAVEGPWKE